jgi:hypothetical protein
MSEIRDFMIREGIPFNSNSGRSSRQLMSQLISMMENDSSFKHDYYKELLRTLLHQIPLSYINDQGERVDVKMHHGRQDRLVAKMFQENNLVLPYSTIYQSAVENDTDRHRTSLNLLARSVWDDDSQRAIRVISLPDVPVKLTYRLSVWTRHLGDLDQIAAQIRSRFHPDITLQTPWSHLTKAYLTQEEDDGSIDAQDREDRVLRRNFDITIHTYIPSPEYRVTSSGKIEKFSIDVDIAT